MILKPDIFDFTDFRSFLREWMEYKQNQRKHYSQRAFLRKAGQSNPGLFKQVVEGKRNLTAQAMEGFIRAMQMEPDEASVFRLLVMVGQAETIEEQESAFFELSTKRRWHQARRLEDQGHRYFSTWYYPAIRELVATKDFRLDAEFVASRIFPTISVDEAQEAIDTLLAMGLIQRQGEGAIQSDTTVKTRHELRDAAFRAYHRGMLERANEALDAVEPQKRHFGAVTLAVPRDVLPELKEAIGSFQEQLLHLGDRKIESAEEVVQVNIQLFPLSCMGES